MNTTSNDTQLAAPGKPKYEAPVIRVMSESEVLSAFQVTAAGTSSWWSM